MSHHSLPPSFGATTEAQIRRRVGKRLEELERSAWDLLVNGDQEAREDKRTFVGLGERKVAALVQHLWDFWDCAAFSAGNEPESWAALPEEEHQALGELVAQDFAPGPGFDDDRFLAWNLKRSLAEVVWRAREIQQSLRSNDLLEALDCATEGLMRSRDWIFLTWIADKHLKGKRGRSPKGDREKVREAWAREQASNSRAVRKQFVAQIAQELDAKPATVDRWLSGSRRRSKPA